MPTTRRRVATSGAQAAMRDDSAISLRAAFMENSRIQPLVDGSVRPNGLDLAWTIDHPARLNLRHLRENPFDVFEFSISGYLVARDRPNWAHLGWTAIPVFLSKAFLPLDLYVNRHARIRSWRDLAGKRVGVPDYNMTASFWMRIMLDQLYDIRAQDITWVNGRRPEQRHSTTLGFREPPPDGTEVRELEQGESLTALLARGAIDAAFGDGQTAAVEAGPTVRRLLRPDQAARLIADFARRTGATPVNHAVVVKESLVCAHPSLVAQLYDAFERSKQEAYRRAQLSAEAYLLFPALAFGRQAAIFGEDPYPSGLQANERMLNLLIAQMTAEGQLAKRPSLVDLFVRIPT